MAIDSGLMATRGKNEWLIRGYRGLEMFYEVRRPFGAYSEKRMAHLLQALAARETLNLTETVDAYAARNTRLSNPVVLEVRRDSKPFGLTCGVNPYFIATVVEKQ